MGAAEINQFVTYSSPRPAAPAPKPAPNLTGVQQQLWELLGTGTVQRDQLVEKLGLPPAEVSNALLLLELAGHIRQLPGGRYERKA